MPRPAEKLGPLDPKTVESAERYERALADLRSSMAPHRHDDRVRADGTG